VAHKRLRRHWFTQDVQTVLCLYNTVVPWLTLAYDLQPIKQGKRKENAVIEHHSDLL